MNLQFQLDTLKSTRENARKVLSEFSLDQLNAIPEGFNNNLIWNYGHMIVTQQLLCYKLSGVQMHIQKELIKKYAKGTKPDAPVSEDEYNMLNELSTKMIQQLETDYTNGIFTFYHSYTTSYGITLDHIDKGISFNNVHEGHHLGNMFSMRKLVG